MTVITVGEGHDEEVLLEEVVGGFWVEVTPAKQVQALLILELDAEHAARNCGRDEVAVTALVV